MFLSWSRVPVKTRVLRDGGSVKTLGILDFLAISLGSMHCRREVPAVVAIYFIPDSNYITYCLIGLGWEDSQLVYPCRSHPIDNWLNLLLLLVCGLHDDLHVRLTLGPGILSRTQTWDRPRPLDRSWFKFPCPCGISSASSTSRPLRCG